ncbi:MAG: hypothetical protein ACRC9T_06300 [Vibrionaceae bacterium]
MTILQMGAVMSGDLPLPSTVIPLSLDQLRSLRAGIYQGVSASSLTDLFVRLRNMPSAEPTTNRMDRLADLQDQLLASSESSPSANSQPYITLRQQILAQLRDFRSYQAAGLPSAVEGAAQTAEQASVASFHAAAAYNNVYSRSCELQQRSSFAPQPVSALQRQTAEQALRLVSGQLGTEGQLHLTLTSPQTLSWFHHLQTMVNAQFQTCSFADDVAVCAFLQPEDPQQWPQRKTLQLVVASLRGYAAALNNRHGELLREQLEAILQQNIQHNVTFPAQRMNLQELIFSNDLYDLLAFFGQSRQAISTNASVQENHPQTRLMLKRNILALLKLFMEAYSEISRAAADLPPSRTLSPEAVEEAVSVEQLEHGVSNFLGYLQRSLAFVAAQETNAESSCSPQQLTLARDAIEMFQRIYQNWQQFLAFLSSSEDVALRQTRVNRHFNVAIHLDNECLISNLRWAIPAMFEHLAGREANAENLISDFAGEYPCVEARASRLLFGPEENIPIEKAVDATRSKVDNVGLYCSKFADSNPLNHQDAVACYEWVINQDAFIGAQALDGKICAKDVFDYLMDDPLYLNDFTPESFDVLKAKYQAILDSDA